MTNTDVPNNEYGLSDDDYAKQRHEARALAEGQTLEATDTAAEVPDDTSAAPDTNTEHNSNTPAAQGTSPDSASGSEAPQNDDNDILGSLPEDTREKVAALLKAEQERAAKLEARIKSDDGRVSAYQRKYEDTRRQFSQLEEKLAAISKPTAKSLAESATTPRLKEAAEADPTLLELLDEAFMAREREFEERINRKLQSVAEPLYEARRHEAERSFNEALDSRYTNWRETVYATDSSGRITTNADGVPVFSEAWATFINGQPAAVQNAIVNVNSAQDALWALDHYAAWVSRMSHATEQQPSQPTQQPSHTASTPNADAIARKRQDDLRRATPNKTTPPPLSAPVNNDIDSPDVEARLRRLAREALEKGDMSVYSATR